MQKGELFFETQCMFV